MADPGWDEGVPIAELKIINKARQVIRERGRTLHP